MRVAVHNQYFVIYTSAKLESTIGVRQHDGLYYFVPLATRSYWDASKYCEKFPGFRLAIFRTQRQFEFGQSIANEAGGEYWQTHCVCCILSVIPVDLLVNISSFFPDIPSCLV